MVSTEKETTLLPNLVVVKFDETSYWREDIQQKAGKIFAYYLIDTNLVTHLASVERNYFCYFLYNRVQNIENYKENDDYTDELTEIENNLSGDDNSMYIKEHTVLNVIANSYCSRYDTKELQKLIETDGYEDFVNTALEYYQANPVE